MNPFETEIWQSLNKLMGQKQIYCMRPNDTLAMRIQSPEAYGLRVPSDFFVLDKLGQVFFLECKSSRNKTSFRLDYILNREHQLDSGKYIVSLNKNFKYYYLINDRSMRRNYRCYALYALSMELLLQACRRLGRKSIKWGELANRSREIERVKQGWSLNELLNIK